MEMERFTMVKERPRVGEGERARGKKEEERMGERERPSAGGEGFFL